MGQAKALKRIIRMALEGKARFEDESSAGRPNRGRRGPEERVASIRMVGSDGKEDLRKVRSADK